MANATLKGSLCQLAWLALILAFTHAYAWKLPEANRDAIVNAINQCASLEETQYWHNHLISRGSKLQLCANFTSNQTRTLSCIEKYIHGISLIEANAVKCCYMLSRDSCRHTCCRLIQDVTKPIENRLMFAHPCMNQFDEHDRAACEVDHNRRIQSCFPQCLALTIIKSISGHSEFKFDAYKQCSAFRDVDKVRMCVYR